ncbi:MAG: ATP-grasp domain-containing protein [Faecousia sp.]
MKKILVLGGGINQLPLIEAAKAEGYYVIVCDYNHEPPGAKLCDKFYEASAGDRNVLLEIAEKEQINGVVANTEALMANVSFVSEKFGLVGNPEQAVQTLLSKSKFRKLQEAIGVYTPKHIEARNLEEANERIKGFAYPIIVKPDENSGCWGTTVIRAKEEKEKLAAAFKKCEELSRDNHVVIEEFVEAAALEEVEAEIFVHEGEILWDGLLLTLRSELLPLIPMTDVYPLPYRDDQIAQIKRALEKTISAAGIVHGEYNAELFFTRDGDLFIMEINARQGGDSIPTYVHKSCGVNLHKLLVTTAVGDNYYWDALKTYKRPIRNISLHPLFSTKTGTFVKLDIDKRIDNHISKIDLFVKPGDTVYATENASHEIGYVELSFPNAQIQMEISRHLWQYIQIVVE